MSAVFEGMNLLFQFLDSFAFIVLAAVGLVIIFGMMGVINLAHGEFINDELGTTVLFVEQNLSVVQQLADRCYAMDHGTIVDELDGTELEDRTNLEEHLAV